MTVQEVFKKLDALQAEIEGHGKLPDDVLRKIQYKFRLDWNYHSNSMEGNSLTMQETRSIMLGNITVGGKPLNDVLEMQGHDEVIHEIIRLGSNEGRISESRIKAIHKGIMHEDDPDQKAQIGVWKTDANYLTNARGEKMQFTLPDLVADEIHDLLNWLNAGWDKIDNKAKDAPHPVALAAEFHSRYLKIHPFYDGNGRTGRILLNLILIAHGYPVVVVKQEEKDNYYKYLSEVQMYGAPMDLFFGFVGGLVVRSQELVLKAIAGEEIEEVDDVLKEIRMFKMEVLAEGIEVIEVSPEVIKKLYSESLRPLSKMYFKKFQEFDDFFASKTEYLVGITESNSYDWEEMGIFWDGIYYDSIDGVMHTDSYSENPRFEMTVEFSGFKGSIRNPFGIEFSVTIMLAQYKYLIILGPLVFIEKLYSETLNQDEIENVVNFKLKEAIAEIKKQAIHVD